jgi:hypothetical protein
MYIQNYALGNGRLYKPTSYAAQSGSNPRMHQPAHAAAQAVYERKLRLRP